MRNVKYSKVIGASMFLLAMACIALAFLHPGLRMAIGYGNGYGYPCETPADCEDANDCTNDSCDPVTEECIWSCNATGPQDPCCGDAACAGNPICEPGPCAGNADASVHD